MRRLLTILFVCFFVAACAAQRVVTIITSLDSNTSEAVTISTAWTGTDGDLILSASVPAAVKVGDTITDSGGNTYLITGISGSTLTSQDFDTATDPATGSATIQDAYAGPTAAGLWEADLDVTTLYVSGDEAQGELYNNVSYNEIITFNGGGTVGLDSVRLTVPTAERGDGTAGTGARFVMSTAKALQIATPSGFDNAYTFEWFEVDQNGQGSNTFRTNAGQNNNVPIMKNLVVHDQNGTDARKGFVEANTRDVLIMNCIFYDNTQSASGTVFGLNLDADKNTGGILNSIVYNVHNTHASGNAEAIDINSDDVDGRIRNNIAMGTVVDGSGTAADFVFAGSTNLTSSNNMSEDATADDGGGSNHQISKTVTNQFVSNIDPKDLHIQDDAADSFKNGVDLGTTPAGVNFDIDNFDRDAGATTWSIGAHDGDNLRGAAVRRRIPSRVF